MKRIISTVAAGFLVFGILLLAMGNPAHAESGSMSKSCSGQVFGEYFYIYAYQYAFVSNNEVASETHSFNFSGALEDEDDYVMQKQASDKYIFYVGPRFTLAIPYHSEDGIYAARDLGGPGENGGWQLLCQ